MHISFAKKKNRLTLWERYLAGDRAAFGELYAYYHKSLTAYCVGRVGSLELAENAASETLIKLLQHPKPQEIENFESWIFTVAKNVCITCLTKAKRRNKLLKENYTVVNNQKPEIEEQFTLENIDDLIRQSLNSKDYKIWQLHQQGYDNQEIAEIIGSTEKTVANRKSTARLKLKAALKEYNDK